MLPARLICRTSSQAWRARPWFQNPCRSLSEALSVPVSEAEGKSYPEKLQRIVTDISQLNLLEVAELNELLRKTLNIPDAPVMAMQGFMAGPGPAAALQEEEEAPKAVQTNFTVKLVGFDAPKKVSLIKEMKNLMEGMNLVQAKKFVESAPTVVKADIGKDEAEKLKQAIEAAGGVCEIS